MREGWEVSTPGASTIVGSAGSPISTIRQNHFSQNNVLLPGHAFGQYCASTS